MITVNYLVDLGLREDLAADWEAVSVLLNELSNLTKDEGLTPVRCLDIGLLEAARSSPKLRPNKNFVEKWLVNLIVWESAPTLCEAQVSAGNVDLPATWKQSLRTALAGNTDWREPQILVSSVRAPMWPVGSLVSVEAPVCQTLPAISIRSVPLVAINQYNDHCCARSDRDPWDLRHHHPPPRGGLRQHPCLLPKPPSCNNIHLPELRAALKTCTVHSPANLIWHYVPGEQWDPETIDEARWRNGSAFPRNSIGGHYGYLDRDQNVWEWDHHERHWDLQLAGGGYERINQYGKRV